MIVCVCVGGVDEEVGQKGVLWRLNQEEEEEEEEEEGRRTHREDVLRGQGLAQSVDEQPHDGEEEQDRDGGGVQSSEGGPASLNESKHSRQRGHGIGVEGIQVWEVCILVDALPAPLPLCRRLSCPQLQVCLQLQNVARQQCFAGGVQ